VANLIGNFPQKFDRQLHLARLMIGTKKSSFFFRPSASQASTSSSYHHTPLHWLRVFFSNENCEDYAEKLY
jgi:hypothetical protein